MGSDDGAAGTKFEILVLRCLLQLSDIQPHVMMGRMGVKGKME